jgi:hypothetical protein
VSTHITERPAQAAEAAPRDSYMAALSAAEHIVSTAPAIPTHIRIEDDGELDIYFHRSAQDVEKFAAAFGVVTSTRPHTDKPGSDIYTSAHGRVNGVPFRVWTLFAAPAVTA